MVESSSTKSAEKKKEETKKEGETKKDLAKGGKADDKDKKAGGASGDDLSEEDKKLRDDLTLLVERLQEPAENLYPAALNALLKEIRASTTSMTSVPKPLKFLRPHFETIKQVYEKIKTEKTKKLCGDLVSVLAMTMSQGRECLQYRLLGSQEPVGSFGHEYVRHLASELAEHYREKGELLSEKLARDITEHHMHHNAEAEAVDLLMEVEKLAILEEHIDEHTQPRVCLYLTSCVPYVPDPENVDLLRCALRLYLKFNKRLDALRTAIILNDDREIKDIFFKCNDRVEQKQMAILLGRQQVFLEVPDDLEHAEDLKELISNSNLSQYFLQLAGELDIKEAKLPEDVYKSHLEPGRGTTFGGSSNVEGSRANLASSFVNGMVNCGFGVDKLITDDGNKWFYKHKDQGMMSAAASLGLIHRWDIDNGLTQLDKYLYANEDYIKAGTLLAMGIIASGVQHECDPAVAILSDYIQPGKPLSQRLASILGLGLAYANSSRASVVETVIPALQDILEEPKASAELLGITALSLGLICVGTGNANAELANLIWACLSEVPESSLSDPYYRYLALAIGLIYLGRQDQADVVLESLRALPAPYGTMAGTLVDACAYAGTGNVLKVQQMLHVCSQNLNEDKEKDKKDEKTKKDSSATPPKGWVEQAIAVLGIGLIASTEDVGNHMSFRMFGHLLRYGDAWIRRAVPLALALTSASKAQLDITETLSKFSHDQDSEVAQNSIFAMGIVGAGTNNARLATMLRQLAGYYQRDANLLFMVRLAQGLVHMGKGTLTLHPYHSDRQLLCLPSLAALLTISIVMLDCKNTLGGKNHYLLYTLVPAMQPRMLITFVEDEASLGIEQVNVPVRVGQAVDVVGQAGKPKTITGFQTQTTPVLLSYGERAELATEEYLSVAPVLEGFVLLKKNPDYQAA